MGWKNDAAKVTTRAQRETKATVRAAASQRAEDLTEARANAGLKDATVAQAENWIDNRLDGQTTVAGVREACRAILKKMVPYIL